MENKGALELSIGTIVIIVIGMSMLILGLVLVNTIFTGSKYNVDRLNEKVREQVSELFAEGEISYVHLANHQAKVKQGDTWTVNFVFINTETGTTDAADFTYTVKAADLSGCRGLTVAQAETWIKARRTGSVRLQPGAEYATSLSFVIPETAPLCIVPYDIEIKKNGQIYHNDYFDIVVES